MKILSIIIMLFMLSGCASSVDLWVINRSQYICKDKRGIDYINFITNNVICSDGTSKDYRI